MTAARFAVLIFLILVSSADGQELTRRDKIEFDGLTHLELTRRIFEGERDMIADLKHSHPVVETYLQSLWPGTNSQSPIDDAYFLSSVDFGRPSKAAGNGRRGYQTVILGQEETKKVRVINGRKWRLNPNGYLDMLFVDIEDFDAETYRLTYLTQGSLGETQCLIFSVKPKVQDTPGRFAGRLWIDTLSLKIVRITGAFTSGHISRGKRFLGGSIPLYLAFDSWREEVKPGIWLPRYTYFDENQLSRGPGATLEISFHWRGHTFIWGYADNEVVRTGKTSTPASLAIDWLRRQKLLANQGAVERHLNAIVQQILFQNNVKAPDIDCQILLTTPIEMFNLDHTIILSRGLLNTVPNDSILSLLLAHQIAELLSGNPDIRPESIFDPNSTGVPMAHGNERTGVYHSSVLDANAWKVGFSYVTGDARSGKDTIAFLDQVARSENQVPNLLKPQFGLGLLELSKSVSTLTPKQASTIIPSLVLRGDYTVDAWSGTLEVRPMKPN